MTKQKHLKEEQIFPVSLMKQTLIGAGIGLLLISIYLLGTGEPNPEWGNFWMVRPLVIVPLAGAMGGLCYYFLVHSLNLQGLNKTIAVILGVILFIIALWLGTVLGLDGTYWD